MLNLKPSSPSSTLISRALERVRAERERRLTEDEQSSLQQLVEASRGRCKKLSAFIAEAWHILEPDTLYVHGWHIDVLCDHLEAVTRGEINRLLINIPPGSSKSLIVSVFWPAWEWAMGYTSYRYITTSYNEANTTRDTDKFVDLLTSAWYQMRWPHVVLKRKGSKLVQNTGTGSRRSSPFGSLTGKRADRLVIDDPHSTESAESDKDRLRTTNRFRRGALNRLNDQRKSAIIIVMQRLHEQDISGVILSHFAKEYVHVCLPMEFERQSPCYTVVQPTGSTAKPRAGRYDAERRTWYFANDNVPEGRAAAVEAAPLRLVYRQDPRTREGELLDPVRFPAAVLAELKAGMGAHDYAGQYQQRPSAREGGMFKRADFVIVDAIPAEAVKKVRRWDLAATVQAMGNDPDFTASVKMSQWALKFYVEDVTEFRRTSTEVRKAIKNTASQDGRACAIVIPKDPGQAGVDQSSSIIAENAGYKITAERETGDKGTRAEPLAAQNGAGNVYLLRAPWNERFIDQLCLAEGTRIYTLRGEIPIERVAVGDKVMTRAGWRAVLDSRCTSEDAVLCRMTFSTGGTLSCTLNHPILVPGFGFKKAGLFQVGDRLLQYIGAPSSSSHSGPRSDIFPAQLTGGTSSCTDTFGSRSAGRSLQSTTSTTLTGWLKIILSTISNVFRPQSIHRGIRHGCAPGPSVRKNVSFAKLNTEQHSPDGLEPAQDIAAKSGKRPWDRRVFIGEPAKSALNNLSQARIDSSFAHAPAQRLEGGHERMPSSQSDVSSAIATSGHPPVPEGFAADLVLSDMCTLPGRHRVFNLQVDEVPEFVANGVIVHNCSFPTGHDDMFDAAAGAFNALAGVTGPMKISDSALKLAQMPVGRFR